MGSLLTIIALMGVAGFRFAAANERAAREVVLYSSLKDGTRTIEQGILNQRLGVRDVLMGGDPDGTHRFVENGETQYYEGMRSLEPVLPDDRTRELCARLKLAATAYMQRNAMVLAVYRSGDATAAAERFKRADGKALSTALGVAVNDLMEEFERRRCDSLSRQVASDHHAKTMMLTLMFAGLTVGLFIASLIARSILDALRGMLAMIHTIALNNLSVADMEVEHDDDLGRAAGGLNQMKNGLRDLVLSIGSTAVSVLGSSREIATTASESAERARLGKQQVQQIASAMEEMARAVREVSQHSHRAAAAARSAAESAREGGRIVEGTRGGMRRIAEAVRESESSIGDLGRRSDDIGKIVNVIDDIARQTNLLALNAAIEAARAGEHGRGFGVVASEVRLLAERITSATKDIAVVIKSVQGMTAHAMEQMCLSTTAVEQGLEVTGRAEDAIECIIREADTVGGLVAQIAGSATQQAATTEEVSASMSEISKIAVLAANGAQLSAGACEQLLQLALGMQKLVDRFDVGQASPAML